MDLLCNVHLAVKKKTQFTMLIPHAMCHLSISGHHPPPSFSPVSVQRLGSAAQVPADYATLYATH